MVDINIKKILDDKKVMLKDFFVKAALWKYNKT